MRCGDFPARLRFRLTLAGELPPALLPVLLVRLPLLLASFRLHLAEGETVHQTDLDPVGGLFQFVGVVEGRMEGVTFRLASGAGVNVRDVGLPVSTLLRVEFAGTGATVGADG